MKYAKLFALILVILVIAAISPPIAAIGTMALMGMGLISIKNPKGYAYDKELVFRNAAKNSYDVALPNNNTVYTETLEIPPNANGRIAVEIVFTAATTVAATHVLTARAYVGDAVDPTTPAVNDFDQPIFAVVNKSVAAEHSVQWILPEQFSGKKYIRIGFTLPTNDLSSKTVNVFMHGLH